MTPIGRPLLPDYAIATVFRIVSTKRNSKAAACLVCGARTRAGAGRHVELVVGAQAWVWGCYACEECFAAIKKAWERVMDAHPQKFPRPGWWGELR